MSLQTTAAPPISTTYEEKFLKEYQRLNPRQKEAVDTVQGPVLVVAGPGTGKTQMLTLRIGNLLRTTDDQIAPQNILCLTYTDNAAAEMHHRLLGLIGPAAHRIKICTFHAFCNDVIQANPAFFGKQQLEPVTPLEHTQMMEQMLDALPPDHELKRLKGSLDYDMRRLKDLFSFMKKEDMRADEMKARVNAYVESLPTRDEFIYKVSRKGAYAKGDLKTAAIEAETRRMNELLAGIELFTVFEEKMRKLGRYDFDDMILWVIDAFRKHPDLVAPYKEQYRYILVDEYQDTSGAQNEILQLLIEDDIDNNPNVFCVGDDDQSIYEFQGARIKNIVDFYEKYKANIKVVVLVENYRSTQAVLDSASRLIGHNTQRLANEIPHIDKRLNASEPRWQDSDVVPLIHEFENTEQEEAWIAAKVKELLHKGVDPKDIGILYFRHKQAASLIEFFAKSKIPYSVKRELNVLDHPLVNQLISILQYLHEERKKPGHADGMLFEILHYRTLGIDPNDLVSLAVYMANQKELSWREAISSPVHIRAMKLSKPKTLEQFAKCLGEWSLDVHNLPLRMLSEKVLNESNMLMHALQQPDSMEVLTVLNTFFLFLQDQTTRRTRMTMEELNDTVQQMRTYNVPLPLMRPVNNRNGVTLTTCHGAKGSEYLYVFILGSTKNIWDDERGNTGSFKLPPTVVYAEESPREETNRRLFYVACTRAKENLYVTYSTGDTKGKSLQACRHIAETELMPMPTKCADADVMEYMKFRMLSLPPSVPVSHKQFLQEQVDKFVLSQSKLNTFLTCPIEFYFRCILRVPFGKHEGMFYGTAVHHALQRAFEEMQKHPEKQFPSTERFLEFFTWCMQREKEQMSTKDYENRVALGLKNLPDYYNVHINEWQRNALVEVIIDKVEVDGIPISGRIDKIELREDGTAAIVDYKTDSWNYNIQKKMKSPNEEEPNGGTYWRQMIFYKLLLDHQQQRSFRVTNAYFEYAEKDKQSGKYIRKEVELDDDSVATVKEQIRTAYRRIKKLDFFTGCGEEDCQWCKMVKDSGLALT